MMKMLGIILLFIHVGLLFWSAGGLVEWLLPAVPWKPYSNPEFPRWLLFIHWASVIVASAVFIYGYFSRWKYTPVIMAAAYGMMGFVCLIETFGYMTSKTKFLAMGLEYAAYSLIVMLLFSARFSAQHFD